MSSHDFPNVNDLVSANTEYAESFDDAVKSGIKRASKTLKNIRGVWVENQTVTVKDGKVSEFRVNMRVTFVLKD